MGRPPRALKVARELRTTGAFVLVVGALIFFAGALILFWLDRLELDRPGHDLLMIMSLLFLIAGFGNIVLGVEVIRKAGKIAGVLKGGKGA